jgi:hypothetical protein
MLIGINDIGFTNLGLDRPPATAATIEAGYEQVIAQVHAAHLRIYAGTLTPSLTLPVPTTGYQDAQGEVVREEVNRWILTSHAFDGVVNFAADLADPSDPQAYKPGVGQRRSPPSERRGLQRHGRFHPAQHAARPEPELASSRSASRSAAAGKWACPGDAGCRGRQADGSWRPPQGVRGRQDPARPKCSGRPEVRGQPAQSGSVVGESGQPCGPGGVPAARYEARPGLPAAARGAGGRGGAAPHRRTAAS